MTGEPLLNAEAQNGVSGANDKDRSFTATAVSVK
jgi:hypothetical protein